MEIFFKKAKKTRFKPRVTKNDTSPENNVKSTFLSEANENVIVCEPICGLYYDFIGCFIA